MLLLIKEIIRVKQKSAISLQDGFYGDCRATTYMSQFTFRSPYNQSQLPLSVCGYVYIYEIEIFAGESSTSSLQCCSVQFSLAG